MDWSDSTFWWLACGALVALELVTGTFYLLMLALGAAAGAIAAHAGLGGITQAAAAALIGAGATAIWRLRRTHEPQPASAESNPDVNLDIGQTLHIRQWQADGTARAQYRGAAWSVRYAGDGAPAPGEHIIKAVHGSELRVAPAAG